MLNSSLKISKTALYLLLLMTVFALIYNIFLPAHTDEAYYWQWGRHLALSYYDGPPLMAYLIRISTTAFGISAWSIKFPAVMCMSGAALAITALGGELFGRKVATTSLLLLIFMPITQAGYVISTLDPALVCFWSITLYVFYLALSREKNRYRYLAGFCLGLTLLAKYPGVLVGMSLFLFMLFSHYRSQLKNINWYLAVLLALLVFSPVIIWNYQQHWASFTFQYSHGVASSKHFQLDLMGSFIGSQLGVANPIFLIAVLYYSIRYFKTIWCNKKLLYVALPFWVTFFFFFYQGLFQYAEANWAAPAYISAAVLLAYFIVHFNKRVLFYAIVGLNIVLTIFMRFPQTTPFLPNDAILMTNFLGFKQVIQQAAPYYKHSDIVISNRIQTASLAALYLPNHPQTYILGDTHRQYSYWSKSLKAAIRAGKVKSVLYVGEELSSYSFQGYFKHSKVLKKLTYNGEWNSRHWVVIRAWN